LFLDQILKGDTLAVLPELRTTSSGLFGDKVLAPKGNHTPYRQCTALYRQ
jgi:hypothetical protein